MNHPKQITSIWFSKGRKPTDQRIHVCGNVKVEVSNFCLRMTMDSSRLLGHICANFKVNDEDLNFYASSLTSKDDGTVGALVRAGLSY